MRLFDRCVSQPGPFADWLREKKPIVLCADQICSHVYESPQFIFGAKDMLYCRPPWETVFVE